MGQVNQSQKVERMIRITQNMGYKKGSFEMTMISDLFHLYGLLQNNLALREELKKQIADKEEILEKLLERTE